jgi:hypothetical protein
MQVCSMILFKSVKSDLAAWCEMQSLSFLWRASDGDICWIVFGVSPPWILFSLNFTGSLKPREYSVFPGHHVLTRLGAFLSNLRWTHYANCQLKTITFLGQCSRDLNSHFCPNLQVMNPFLVLGISQSKALASYPMAQEEQMFRRKSR